MTDPSLADDHDDALADRLRAAADAVTPAFSPARHAAILRHVRRPPAGRRWVAAAAAAVVVGIATVAGVLTHRRSPVPPPHELAMLPSVPAVPDPVTAVADPLARQFADARRDYLDRTTDQLTRFCRARIDHLPSLPRAVEPPAN